MDLPYRGFALDATSQLCEEAGGWGGDSPPAARPCSSAWGSSAFVHPILSRGSCEEVVKTRGHAAGTVGAAGAACQVKTQCQPHTNLRQPHTNNLGLAELLPDQIGTDLVRQVLGSTSSKTFLLNYKMPLGRWYRRQLLEYIECSSVSVILALLRNIRAIKGAQSTLLCSVTPFPSNNKALVV